MATFSKKEAINFGFEVTKKHFLFILGALAIYIFVAFASSLLFGFLAENTQDTSFAPLVAFISWTITNVVNLIISIGMIRITLALVDGKKLEYGLLFKTSPKEVIRYIAASVLLGLVVFAGLILFVIPGIILGIKYQYSSYLIVDKNMRIMESIRESGKMTQGIKWDLFVFGVLLLLLNIAGILALGVGILFTSPLSSIAAAYVYRKLQQQSSRPS